MSANPEHANPTDRRAQLFKRMADLGPQDVGDEKAAEAIAALREKFESSTDALADGRVTRADGTKLPVVDLPWYVVIGAPGSGNSTVLQQSGLRFPLQGEDSPAQLTGVGGTRYCEWWFSDEAVFIDTAGRYVAHESRYLKDALAGNSSWHAFLALLKQNRRDKPINGAIVTVSVTDLLLWAKPERQQFSAHVRMRLSEIYAGLNTRFPVYLLVTKMDLLAGFHEFFDGLDDAARTQVWGTTFEPGLDPVDISKKYSGDFAVLQDRLYAEMLARLEEEPDLTRRASIYRFPQQFHAIGPLVQEFIGMAFSMQVDHQPFMLRGAYFISATQAGKPIDRVMRTLERAFKVEHSEVEASGPSKSFFVTRLLREVIFPEARLAVDNVTESSATGRSPATVLR
jgi:type VI secretion system protein ImpL